MVRQNEEVSMVKKLVCIKCGGDWKGYGSPAVCPDCSRKEGKQVLSAAVVVEKVGTLTTE